MFFPLTSSSSSSSSASRMLEPCSNTGLPPCTWLSVPTSDAADASFLLRRPNRVFGCVETELSSERCTWALSTIQKYTLEINVWKICLNSNSTEQIFFWRAGGWVGGYLLSGKLLSFLVLLLFPTLPRSLFKNHRGGRGIFLHLAFGSASEQNSGSSLISGVRH